MTIRFISSEEADKLVSPSANLREELRQAISAMKPDQAFIYEVKGNLTVESVRASASTAARHLKIPISCSKIPGTENLLIRRKM